MVAAGCAALVFSVAFVALVSSQLALMSVLDADRAERAAEQIAESRFTADLIDRTVVRALAPVAGDALARQAATVASNDPNVIGVVEMSLLDAHGQIVDRDAPAEAVDGNAAVGSAIVTSIVDGASANGVDVAALGFDPTAITGVAGAPQVVPADLPRLGLRGIAETTRVFALFAAIAFASIAVLVHPRCGRSLRGLGVRAIVVTGTWLVALLVTGWVIGLSSDTLFGEMIQAVWSDAVTSMLFLVGAGVAVGIGMVFAGISADGFGRRLRSSASRGDRPSGVDSY